MVLLNTYKYEKMRINTIRIMKNINPSSAIFFFTFLKPDNFNIYKNGI